jgi:hypothetical protein
MGNVKVTNDNNPIVKRIKRTKMLFILVILYLCIFRVSPIDAQELSDQLNWTQFLQLQKSTREVIYSSDNPYYVLVIPNVSSELYLNEKLTVLRRVDQHGHIVRISSAEKYQDITGRDFQLYPANKLWKLNNKLLSEIGDSVSKDLLQHVYVKFLHEGTTGTELAADHEMTAVAPNIYSAFLSRASILKLLEYPEVVYVGAESNKLKKEATVLDLNLHPNRINALHHFYPNIKGQNELVSIQEPLYNKEDIDLLGRYISLGIESSFNDNHATEMATIIGGAGNSFVTGAGVAPHVKHTSADNLAIFPQDKNYYLDNNILVQNHSYGTEVENFYGALAYGYDINSYENPNILHVQSAGNAGAETTETGDYAELTGFSNLTGNFKQAKNVLAVGSVDTAARPIPFSSAGPTFDGRVKPEIVTYSVTGTSNSAALVSGTLVLLQQYYKEKFNEPMPSALAKAILINTADEAGAKGIDYKTGFGQLNALGAIEAIREEQFMTATLKNGETWTHSLQIPENAINLKVTMVWLDPPANINDQLVLQNDLDLSIKDNNNKLYLPEVLSSYPHLDSLALPAIAKRDRLNNIEQIRIDQPLSVEFTFEVRPYRLNSQEQVFYLIYQYDIENTFRWTSPTGSDNIPYNGETTSHLRWESSFNESVIGKLFFKNIALNTDWQLLDNQIDLSIENYRWEQPSMEGRALLKMEIESQRYPSDTFTVSTPVKTSVLYNCTDSLLLAWTKKSYANQYQLNQLIGGELVALTTTTDTSIVLYKEALTGDYFQIIPIIGNDSLLQSFTINYQLQGGTCYIKSLFSYVVQDSGIFIMADIGYTVNVEKAILEKRVNNKWITYQETTELSNTMKFIDQDPDNGLNIYRLRLLFNNSSQIVSDETAGIYVKDKLFIVYPNPISIEEELKVFGRSVKQLHTFELFTTAGNSIILYYFNNDRAYVELPTNIEEGLYIYHIYTVDGTLSSGKLLIKN